MQPRVKRKFGRREIIVTGLLLLFIVIFAYFFSDDRLNLDTSGLTPLELSIAELAVRALTEQDVPIRQKLTDDSLRSIDLIIESAPPGILNIAAVDGPYFAFDPFLLYIDTNSPEALVSLAETGSLQDFLFRLPALSADFTLPLGVAGNEDYHFLSFLLILAAEILPAADFRLLLDDLQASGDEIPGTMQPVLDFVRNLVLRGVLAGNWTNWDIIALNDAVTSRQFPVVFVPASYYKGLKQNQSFHLVQKRLPSGQGRRTYMLAGTVLQVVSTSRRGADRFPSISSVLKSSDFQKQLALSSKFSPVSGKSPFVDLNHRNLLSWLDNAEHFLSISIKAINPSILAAIRIALR